MQKNRIIVSGGDLTEELKAIEMFSQHAKHIEDGATQTVTCNSFLTIYCC